MILWSLENGHPMSARLTQALTLTAEPDPSSDARETDPRLVPTATLSGVVGGLLVPQALDRTITHNGVPLTAGAYVLRHTDRLGFGGRTWWIAADNAIACVPYQPLIHGEDVYCLVTKARLNVDEAIVVCPGPAGGHCGALYREAAWDMVRQTNDRFRCPRCGFEPGADEWQPTLPRLSNLEQLFELARQQRMGGPV